MFCLFLVYFAGPIRAIAIRFSCVHCGELLCKCCRHSSLCLFARYLPVLLGLMCFHKKTKTQDAIEENNDLEDGGFNDFGMLHLTDNLMIFKFCIRQILY